VGERKFKQVIKNMAKRKVKKAKKAKKPVKKAKKVVRKKR
jgi:hypothetical protein